MIPSVLRSPRYCGQDIERVAEIANALWLTYQIFALRAEESSGCICYIDTI